MPSPSSRDPRSTKPEEGAVDGILKRFARGVSDRTSRRSVLFSAGSAVAALFGVKFLAPYVSNTGVNMAFAAAPAARRCKHPDDCTSEGRKCAMGSSVDCGVYQDKKCKTCFKATGCPGATVKGGSWRGCCLCPKDPKNGHYFEYYDCCGTQADIDGDPDCSARACDLGVAGSGCPSNIQERDCDAFAGSSEVSWCGTTPGDPMCTMAVQGGSCSI